MLSPQRTGFLRALRSDVLAGVQEHRPRESFEETRCATESAQKFRIECFANAAISHCRRVARQRPRRDPRGRPRGSDDRLRRDHRAAAPPPGRLWPRTAHGHRIRSRRGAQRHSPRRVDRRADRAVHSEQGLGELAAHDVLGAGAAGRRLGRRSAGGHPPPAGACRPRRRREVRPRRYSRRAGARQRPRDRRPRGGRLHCPPTPLPARHRHRQPCRVDWIRLGARSAGIDATRRCEASSRTARCTARTRTPSRK